MKIIRLSLLFLLGLSRLAAQEAGIELPGQTVLKKIFNKPGIVKTEVSQEMGDDKIRWIEVYTDAHIATDVPLDKLRRAILDFDNYPRMFKRNQSIAVIREDGRIYNDMTMGAEFLGIFFLTTYRVEIIELRNTPEEYVIEYRFVSGDGKIKEFYGRWYLERIPRSEGGKDQYYVRYYASSTVIRKYPLQRFIMSLFINSESRDLLEQFIKTAGEYP
ncbi:hypothetical protein AGMMS49942_20290 [Spirochaetia bacterium]|nr:hypothetical protein AGMMS49942_20290 [Spirochaetia bacterium]